MMTPEDYAARSTKAAATRVRKDPDAFKKMGSNGGKKGGRPFRDIPGLAKKAAKKRNAGTP